MLRRGQNTLQHVSQIPLLIPLPLFPLLTPLTLVELTDLLPEGLHHGLLLSQEGSVFSLQAQIISLHAIKTKQRQEMPLVRDFRCLELCLYDIREPS